MAYLKKNVGTVTGIVTQGEMNAIDDDIALLGFKTASTNSVAKYDLANQTVDNFDGTTGIDTSASTGEVRNASDYIHGQAAESYRMQICNTP